jgi:hypothetical protein
MMVDELQQRVSQFKPHVVHLLGRGGVRSRFRSGLETGDDQFAGRAAESQAAPPALSMKRGDLGWHQPGSNDLAGFRKH